MARLPNMQLLEMNTCSAHSVTQFASRDDSGMDDRRDFTKSSCRRGKDDEFVVF